MRVSVLRGVGDVAVEERPIPQPGRDEVLVRVACRRGLRIGRALLRARPDRAATSSSRRWCSATRPPGEVVGRRHRRHPARAGPAGVARAGRPLPLVRPVPRRPVQPVPGRALLRHAPATTAPSRSTSPCTAAFAHPIPDSVSDDAAALLEPLSVGIWACRRGRVSAGTRVLVTGAGPIGLVCAQAARAFGATQVWVSDVNPHRLALAERLGATAPSTCRERPVGEHGLEPDVLLECSGNARATRDAILTVARAGRVVLVGMGSDDLPIPLPYVQDRELVLTAPSATPTPGRPRSRWWPPAASTWTRWSPATTGWTTSSRR